eukprot:87957_1
MGNGDSKGDEHAYPEQQYQYEQQMAEQQAHAHPDIPQPKPQLPPQTQYAVPVQTQNQESHSNVPIVPIAAGVATGTAIASQHAQAQSSMTNPNTAITSVVTSQTQQQQIKPGYVAVTGADGKQYLVPQGPAGTVPVVVQPQRPPPQPKQFKTWNVKIVATSDGAKQKVMNGEYESTDVVIGIVCAGDKYDGYNQHGRYGAYGYSRYGDLNQQKLMRLKVRVSDNLAIQQNTQKHYLEFWKNGQMLNK